MIAAAIWWGYVGLPLPLPEVEWGRWALLGLGLASVAGLLVAFLLGPAARYLSGERTPLSDIERQQMTATERLEALNVARHTLIQAITGLVIIGGATFTGLGLWYTARTLETTQEGQITDRYTKAVEQLGSEQSDVRLGGIAALGRVADDSPRDQDTIGAVLEAYVRNHDACTLSKGQTKLPQACTAKTAEELAKSPVTRPGADVVAAIGGAVDMRFPPDDVEARLAALKPDHVVWEPGVGADFSRVRFPRADLTGTSMRGADLTGANLRGADLSLVDLRAADLSGADLRAAKLSGAGLTDADLRGADLRGADLRGADLEGADLEGADLTDIRGMTEQEIRAVAGVDSTTMF
ncbi:pentapeptide repeat-containing protein [Nonomuraea sp. NPDC049784]|uniref:pentapeptide repeat-containing protein n=1 Tax=Nonomuraea sp. NPDC049784 TaxID=3154361 RepID=UPI0034118C66